MDHIPYTNPLEAVQFISIFSYLNALSDFLFIENYLAEIDQKKQIPVVNAFYEYFEDHHNNQTMKLKLIRYLLKGSDLYGEDENENPDVIFVNTMFDYIIKSLVFAKYGNIYGFLADVVRKAKRLQLNSLLKEIKASLRNATFENEYGESSMLTPLAANRIFSDIILPLFPLPKTNLSILSLDYIYAQAGSNFLKPGRINTTYYSDSKIFNSTILDEENLFDEYLTTGLIIDNSLFLGNISLGTLRAFALPALFFYVSAESVEKENITNIVFDPYYWKAAYENFFSYLDTVFNEARKRLINDTTYQLHMLLSNFYKFLVTTTFSFKNYLKTLQEEGTEASPSTPFINQLTINSFRIFNTPESYALYINDIVNIYKKHDLKSIKKYFGKSLLEALKYDNVDIYLLAPADNVVLGIFDNVTRLSYDLFEFHYADNNTSDYYALIRKNYTTLLIKETDNPKYFKEVTNITVLTLVTHCFHRTIMKSANETMDEFWNKFISYKQQRLESYLKFSNNVQNMGKWWSEFGFSLMPFYPCSAESEQKRNIEQNVCRLNQIKFLNGFNKDISSLIIQENTRSLLSSFGTTIDTIFLKNIIDQKTESISKEKLQVLPLHERRNITQLFKKLSLHIEEPVFEITSITKKYLGIFDTFVYVLQSKIDSNFTSITNILDNLYIFDSKIIRKINADDEEEYRPLFINSYNSALNTGYGYKFIYLGPNKTAQLRTDYEENTKIFVKLIQIEQDGEKMYSIIPNDSFVEGHRYIFEINNNQLRRSVKTGAFFGIALNALNNEKCNPNFYLRRFVPLVECSRHARLTQQRQFLNECVELAAANNANLTKQEILETLKIYTFPDEDRMDLKFVEDWTKTADLTLPEWGKHYIIENKPLFLQLRYSFQLDDPNLSIFNGTFRIDSIYSFRERTRIEVGKSLEEMIEDFNSQKVNYVATFEDYYAILNFAKSGYRRISASTNEANYMKLALYKLAIRQFDDPDDEFDLKLFRIESIPLAIVNRTLFSRKMHILKKFSMFHTNLLSAIYSAAVAFSGYKNVLYEVKFTQTYIRAKINQYHHQFNESISILLPGTEFSIVDIEETKLHKLGDCVKVGLVFNHQINKKYEGYKNIMKEIAQIEFGK